MKRRQLLMASASVGATAGTGAAWAAGATPPATQGCPAIAASGEINIVGNSFPAIQHVARIAEGCARPGFKVAFKLTPQARTETEQAFASAGRSPFDAAVISMGVFSNLNSRRQLQPLTDLVKKYQQRYQIEERMLVRVDGDVMAIAFMQNTQSLYYRADLFAKHRLAVPTTYAQMLQAAAVLKQSEPSIAYPVAQGFAKGFDSGTEFVNLLASLGGRMFAPGSAEPLFNGPAGLQAVELMRGLLPYMTPNALASNSDDVVNQFQQGKAAMGVLWASRAARMDDAAASKVVGQMQFAAAPAAQAGGPTAAHLWWDGVALPRNAPRQREATFQVLMEGLSEASVKQGNDLALWVRSVYVPGRFGAGLGLAQAAGAPVWPSEPFFSLAHGEVGKVLPDALAGVRPVQVALDAAAAAYRRAAVDKGFLRPGPVAVALHNVQRRTGA